MKKRNSIVLEKMILLVILFILLISVYAGYHNNVAIGLMIILVETYILFKVRKNIYLFFIYMCIFYFDYSVIFGKYIGTPISRLSIVYSQIPKSSDVWFIGLFSILLFHLVIALLLPKINNSDNIILYSENNKHRDVSVVILTILSVSMIFSYLLIPSTIVPRTIYEYAIIPLCLGLYLSKNYKVCHLLLIICMIVSTLLNMIDGGRIISLLPMIAFFVIYVINKIHIKELLLYFVGVVVIFTFAGLYGDLLDEGKDTSILNYSILKETFKNRKFTLDTSVAAYWAGQTFIASRNVIPLKDRIDNFIQYNTKYSLLGKRSHYIQVYELSRKYYVHYNGGFITSYYYFWLGYVGVVLIALYISFFIRIINSIRKNDDLKKIISIYFIATMPRWYLYYPTPLIRGSLILLVLYFFTLKIFDIRT